MEDEKELRVILKRITEMRDKLYEISKIRCLSDPELVKASQEMDELLNKYRLLRQKRNR